MAPPYFRLIYYNISQNGPLFGLRKEPLTTALSKQLSPWNFNIECAKKTALHKNGLVFEQPVSTKEWSYG